MKLIAGWLTGNIMRRYIIYNFVGTTFISFAVLDFEITTIRTINFVVGGNYIYYAIAFAMLGLSAAGVILSLFEVRRLPRNRSKILAFGCVVVAGLILFSNFSTVYIKADLNTVLARAGHASGISGIAAHLFGQSLLAAIKIGGTLLLPYFIFGAVLSFLFFTTERHRFGQLYAADLVGAAIGCFCAILSMGMISYGASVTLPAVVALFAAAAFGISQSRRISLTCFLAAIILCALSFSSWFGHRVEPPADPHRLARDYTYSRKVHEVWHAWNSYTRVGAELFGNTGAMSLGNGRGVAWLAPLKNDGHPWRFGSTIPALLLGPPKDALVLFAGAGADMISLREQGVQQVWGVELNRILVNGAFGLKKFHLRQRLSDGKSHLVISEARNYLARDRRHYDLILLSYSGEPVSYYLGAVAETKRYSFTYQGLTEILNHLKPNGFAVILQINKVNMLAELRKYLNSRKNSHPTRTAIILFNPRAPYRLKAWDALDDLNPLLIKPSGWTDAEVAKIKHNAAKVGYRIAYAPGLPSAPGYGIYRSILKAKNYQARLSALDAATHRRFEIKTDNNPFIYDMFANRLYLSSAFWEAPLKAKATDLVPFQVFRWLQVCFLLIVFVVTMLLVIMPLFFRKGPALTYRTVSHLGYFFCLGAGFMIIEVGLMQITGILFDTPGETIATVMAGIIFFMGLGSLNSSHMLGKKLPLRMVACGVSLYALMLYEFLSPLIHAILPWPIVARGSAVLVIIAPVAFLMGHLFPKGLVAAANDDRRLVPWAWGINGATSTIGAGIVPLLSMAWGFNDLFLLGASFYAALLIFSRSKGAAAVAR